MTENNQRYWWSEAASSLDFQRSIGITYGDLIRDTESLLQQFNPLLVPIQKRDPLRKAFSHTLNEYDTDPRTAFGSNQQSAEMALWRLSCGLELAPYLTTQQLMFLLNDVNMTRLISSTASDAYFRTYTLELPSSLPGGSVPTHLTFRIENGMIDTFEKEEFEILRSIGTNVKYVQQRIITPWKNGFYPIRSFADSDKEANTLWRSLANTKFFLCSPEFFRKHLNSGCDPELVPEAKASHWVQVDSHNKQIIYLPAARALSASIYYLAYNNIRHEDEHGLTALTYNPFVSLDYGGIAIVDAISMLPTWFLEGKANIFSLRDMETDEDGNDFTTKFINEWDGILPKASEFLRVDSPIHYFFYTLFTSYLCYSMGLCMKHEAGKDTFAKSIWRGYNAFNSAGRSDVEFMLLSNQTPDGKPESLGMQKLKHLYNQIATDVSLLHRPLPAFEDLLSSWDTFGMKFFEAWVNGYFQPVHKAKLRERFPNLAINYT